MTREEYLVHLGQQIGALSARVAEVEIQARFALNNQRMFKPNAIVDAKGQREMINGWDAYTQHGGRDYTLTVLERELIANIVADAAKVKVDNGDTRPIEDIIKECSAEYWQQRQADEDRESDSGRDLEPAIDPATGRAH